MLLHRNTQGNDAKDTSTSSSAVGGSGPTLHRDLQNRHIQLIALGGVIGTDLFLNIGPMTQMAGPTVLLGYAVTGIVTFPIMCQLDEMVAEEPVPGSFAHFAYKYWGPFAGFLFDWNCWVVFVLVGMAGLIAAGICMQCWLPDVSTWVQAAASPLTVNTVSLVNVRLHGEAGFWFALIKVLTTIGMIAFGLWMLFDGHGGSKAGFDNLWKHGGFLATGWYDLILSLAVTMFSFGRLELIDTTTAEAQNPEENIPKTVNQVAYRILLFYIGSLVVLLAPYPWVGIKSNSSPFMMIPHHLDSNLVASTLNFVILVASLPIYSGGVYSSSQMLFGLLMQGNVSTFLARVSKRGVPVNSLLLSGVITSLMMVLNYLLLHEALGLLMVLVVATLLLNRIMICMAYLKFRAARRRKGCEPEFKALLASVSNHFYVAFLGLTLVPMCTIDDMRLSMILLPAWILFLFITFKLLRRPA